MKTAFLSTAACLLAAAPCFASLHRVALVVGANDGGGGRAQLKYAVADAERFARVLYDLGGLSPDDAIVLKQPTPHELEAAFGRMRARVDALRAGGEVRTEALVYYSGHADQAGLLLGDDRVSYRSFRGWMDALPADVRIGVIDACASGAITRIKGGRPRPPFVVDAANRMRGHAFLTSSSAGEVAQESDRIAASFFTHYLISGLRGAADLSGEGTVTLGEAYHFAFRETLGRTAETKAGAQHPSYDLQLSGTGDVVITDVRQTSARLVLADEVQGRCFVRDSEGRLVVELMKQAGRRIDLGLAPGPHEVRCQRAGEARVARAALTEGQETLLGAGDFSAGNVDRAAIRGGASGLAGRGRLDVTAGLEHGVVPRFGGLGYSRWLSPRLAVTLDAGRREGGQFRLGDIEEKSAFGTFRVGVRRYTSDPSWAVFNPFLEAGVGLHARSSRVVDFSPVAPNAPFPAVQSRLEVEPAGWFGIGADVRFGRSFMLGARVSAERVGVFESRLFPSYGSLDRRASLSLGFLFGRRSVQP
jgi:hypothetical protein